MTNQTLSVPVELLERSAQMIQFYVEYLCATNSEESDIELAGECVDELRALLATPPADHSDHLPPLIQCLRENGQQIAERAFDAQEGKYSQEGQASAAQVPEAAALSDEIEWLIRQWDAGVNWSGERMAELLEAAGKAAAMLAAAPKAPEGRELVPLLVEARQAMLMHWKPKSVNAGFIRASLIERIDAALSAAQAGGGEE